MGESSIYGASWRDACMHLHNFLCYYYRIKLIVILIIVFVSIIHVAEGQNDEIHHVDFKIHNY